MPHLFLLRFAQNVPETYEEELVGDGINKSEVF